jgi:hypothetical protein
MKDQEKNGWVFGTRDPVEPSKPKKKTPIVKPKPGTEHWPANYIPGQQTPLHVAGEWEPPILNRTWTPTDKQLLALSILFDLDLKTITRLFANQDCSIMFRLKHLPAMKRRQKNRQSALYTRISMVVRKQK